MLNPRRISDLELAFPAHVLGTYLPRPEWIGERNLWLNSPWAKIVDAAWADTAEALSYELTTLHEVETLKRHLQACLGSYEPSHQDKVAGMAFLLALWWDVDWPPEHREIYALQLQAEARTRAGELEWEPIHGEASDATRPGQAGV